MRFETLSGKFAYVALWILVTVTCPRAAFTYKGCPDATDADFKAVTLFSQRTTDSSTAEPLKMAFDMDAQGNVDVYYVQRQGRVRKYDGAKKALVELGNFTFAAGLTESSDGLIGIALDPYFKTNRWIYIYRTGSKADWRLSRFTLKGESIDMASEKVLLVIPEKGPSQHTGGAMQFDYEGNLWITTGDNNNPASSANTNDYRGKILRIKPIPFPDTQTPQPGAGTTYTIPKGNLFEPGMAQTKPEIYVMGTRNPYTLTLDPVRKAITWGDVGPDAGKISEEHNFTTVPGNFGWPYFAGENIRFKEGGTPEKPVNNDPSNTGLVELPPAIPALHSYKQSCAITGPVYYYNGDLASKIKFPPHFDGKWFTTEFGTDTIGVISLDSSGTQIRGIERIFKSVKLFDPIDMQMGPDGALYYISYSGYRSSGPNTGISRIEYTGTCQPKVTPSPIPTNALTRSLRKLAAGSEILDTKVWITAQGGHKVEVMDLSGRVVSRFAGIGPAQYGLEGFGNPGIYVVTVTTGLGTSSDKVVLR